MFHLFYTYVANVSSGYCKSRFDVAHVVVEPTCRSHLLAAAGLRHACGSKEDTSDRHGKWSRCSHAQGNGVAWAPT